MSWLVTPAEKTPVDKQGIGSVSLLLHGNGTNGSTTITDSSPSPKVLTPVGGTQISTAQSKFGGASILFGTAAGDKITVPASSALALGASDFTFEGWFYPTSFPSNTSAIVDYRSTGGSQANFPIISFNTSGNAVFSTTVSLASSGTLSTNQWTHVAFVRVSGTLTIYLSGQASGSTSLTNNFGCNGFSLGALHNQSSSYYAGYIDELRITKGVARYTANFTPPTAPFPDI